MSSRPSVMPSVVIAILFTLVVVNVAAMEAKREGDLLVDPIANARSSDGVCDQHCNATRQVASAHLERAQASYYTTRYLLLGFGNAAAALLLVLGVRRANEP